MRKRRLVAVSLFSALLACFLLECARLDVRLGTGDGEGVRLSYRTVGEGEPLVVIHDGPGYEKSLMYPAFDGLASDLRVIYYDQRGCGQSQPLSSVTACTIADNVEDLEALRRYMYLPRISIAAHGWGVVIALEYARKYADRVESLMLITPISPFLPKPRLESVMEHLSPQARNDFVMLHNDPTLGLLEKREKEMRLIVPALFYNRGALRFIDLDHTRFSPEVNIRLGEELKSLDLFRVLDEIHVPTLVVVGRHDPATPVMDQMAYADGIETATAVVFNGSGHFPLLEQRSLFLKVAKEFLLHKRLPALVHLGSGA
jgi:proline iminopeptidase